MDNVFRKIGGGGDQWGWFFSDPEVGGRSFFLSHWKTFLINVIKKGCFHEKQLNLGIYKIWAQGEVKLLCTRGVEFFHSHEIFFNPAPVLNSDSLTAKRGQMFLESHRKGVNLNYDFRTITSTQSLPFIKGGGGVKGCTHILPRVNSRLCQCLQKWVPSDKWQTLCAPPPT